MSFGIKEANLGLVDSPRQKANGSEHVTKRRCQYCLKGVTGTRRPLMEVEGGIMHQNCHEQALRACLLSRRCKHGVELTERDLAAWYDTSYQAVNQRITRALKKMKTKLAEEGIRWPIV